MAEQYNSFIHTSENLALQLETLTDRGLVLVGSVGRAAWLGQLFDLERPDHTASDIDAIATDHDAMVTPDVVNASPAFEEDTKLTRCIRPISSEQWGLYTPTHRDEPYAVVDAEFMQPQLIEIPWSDGLKTSVLPPAVMAETIGLFGPYTKHKAQVAQFKDFAQKHPLPPDVQRTMHDYRYANAYGETNSQRAYIFLRRAFRDHAPASVKTAVEKHIGPSIRRFRGTTIQ